MRPDDYVGWLALALTPGLGTHKLLRAFGSPDAIYGAEAQRLPAAVRIDSFPARPLSHAAKEMVQAQAAGCIVLTWDEPEYPERLREIHDPRLSSISKEIQSF